MRKLAEVQKAEELMHEAMGWSEFKWLFQKSTVRETADEAERHWCISLAREACNKAIHAWALREKAIRRAEGVQG